MNKKQNRNEVKSKFLTLRITEDELSNLTKFSKAQREPRGKVVRDILNNAIAC